jgi:hypothetical protein
MKTSLMILACLLFLAACSKVKELDKRTESMEKATGKMSSTTDDLKDTTTVMYRQIRSKESEATRETKFEILTKDDADMGTRVTAAGVYFRSMEFQLWNNNSTFDDKDTLDVLYIDAANEFTRRMLDLYNKVNVQSMSPTKNNKMESSFYALAATIHMNHSYQEERAAQMKAEPVSMYDLVKKALLKDANHKPLKEHEEILLNGINKEIMIELIKARVDIMSALALKNLTDKRDMTLGQKAKGLLFQMSFGRLGSIDLPEVYQKSNEATNAFTERYLESATKAKKFLHEIGVEKPLERTLRSAYRNIDFNEKNSIENKEQKDVKKELIQSMINTLLD